MKKTTLFSGFAAAVLALSACSQNTSEPETETLTDSRHEPVGEPQYCSFERDGGTVKLEPNVLYVDGQLTYVPCSTDTSKPKTPAL